jgi:hypothetical protein
MPLDSPCNEFSEEMRLVGEILTSYSELEFQLACCVGEALRDTNAAFQLLFSIQTESDRIEAADAILYPAMKSIKAARFYIHVSAALRYCKAIRDQYTHCHWDRTAPELRLLNMKEVALSVERDAMSRYSKVTIALLREQASYFEYCYDGLRYLHLQQQVHAGGGIDSRSYPKPKRNNHRSFICL